MPKRICWTRFLGPLPPKTKSVMRPSPAGNIYPLAHYSRAESLQRYEAWLASLAVAHREAILAPLRGQDLACSCKLTEACHADIILRWANP